MMRATTTKNIYLRGFRDGAPFVLVVAPFALLFGVVATEAGMSVAQTLGFSVVVIAGAAQFAAVQLMVEDAPAVIVLATALAVNLRMAMYSASITPYLGAAPFWKRAVLAYFLVDQSYAVSLAKFETEPAMPVSDRVTYFMGVVSPVFPLWYLMTLAGALVGARIPPEYALDFAVPITFLAIIAPMLKTAAHVAAALTSVLLALVLAFLPYNLGLIVAGIGAMMVGAQVELLRQKARA